LSLSIIRVAEEHAMKESTGQVLVQAPVEIANYLLNEKRSALADIEKRHSAPVVIVADEHLTTPHYEVTRLRENELSEDTARPSYQRGTPRKLPTIALTKGQVNVPPEAAVTKVQPTQPAPVRAAKPASAAPPRTAPAPAPNAASEGGVFAWFKRILGVAEETPAPQPAQRQNGRRNNARDGRSGDSQRENTRNGQRRNQQQRREQRDAQREDAPGREQQAQVARQNDATVKAPAQKKAKPTQQPRKPRPVRSPAVTDAVPVATRR